MLKLIKLLLIIVFCIGCTNSKKETDMLVFESHIKQYLDLFIKNNKKLNSENNVIVITCNDLGDNEFILDITSNLQENAQYAPSEVKDSIYYGYYDGFKMFIKDNNLKVLKNKQSNIKLLKESYTDNFIPIVYEGSYWNLKISDGKLVDFSYFFCQVDDEIIEKLKLIQIPSSWGGVSND